MNETAAFLVDQVIAPVPVRHWVCTVPPALRFLLAHDVALCNEVVAFFSRAVFRWLKRQAKHELGLASVNEAHPAAVTVVHRASSHLALNIHPHSLVADGVWVAADPSRSSSSSPPRPPALPDQPAPPVFRALPAPCRGDLMSVGWEVCTATLGALRRRGLWLDADPDADPFTTAEPGLAHCQQASIAGVLTVGRHAGQRVLRIGAHVGHDADAETSTAESTAAGCITPGYGFSVHAARRVSAHDRAGLERLARYVTRPPLAQDRLKRLPDGNISWELRHPWADGTRRFIFEPLDFLAKLAALVVPPRTHRIRYQGAWARRSKLRPLIVPRREDEAPSSAVCGHGRPGPGDAGNPGKVVAGESTSSASESTSRRRPRYDWASLMKRVFSVDVLACPKCPASMQRIAWVTRPDAIRKILASVGLPADSPAPAPSRWPEQEELFAAG